MRVYHLLACLALTVFSSTTPSVAQDFARQADMLLQAYHKAGLLNGTVLVAEGDRILYSGGFGEANMSWGVPNAPDTKFRIASTTKQFTSALIHRLAEEGRVNLNAPISTYLPSYPLPQGDRIFVRHLLNQTSGIPNYTSLRSWEDIKRDAYTPDAFLDVFSDLDLDFVPGSRFGYSNSNYFVLGVIIERVTGQSYAAALREWLLDPLGLDNTGYVPRTHVVDKMAAGYVKDEQGAYVPEAYVDVSLPYAAGMLYSTVEDLHTWMRALHGGRVFQDPATLGRMLTPSGDGPYGYAHGLGFNRRAFGPDTLLTVGHGGHIEGFNSDDRYFPEREWSLVVLDNTNGDVGRVGSDLVRLLLGQEAEGPE
ncbi:MAG: serine hydrolase domain-containing protein [Rhodothermales bacterium]